MKLAECHKAEQDFSGTASDIARKLGYAGLAIIWIFRVELSPGSGILTSFVPAAILIIIGLLVDLGQYIYGATKWGFFARKKAKELGDDKDRDFQEPKNIAIAIDWFFYGKILLIGFAYIFIVIELVRLGFFVTSGTAAPEVSNSNPCY